MKVKIGSFSKHDGNEIAEELKKMGLNVEVKRYIEVTYEELTFLEGNLSKLKEMNLPEVSKWEEYINAAKEIIEQGIEEGMMIKEFKDKFMERFLPEGGKDISEIIKLKIEAGESVDEEEIKKALDFSIKKALLSYPIEKILELVEVQNDEDKIEKRIPDDPYLSIPVMDFEGDLPEGVEVSSRIEAMVDEMVDIYTNVADILNLDERVEELDMDTATSLMAMYSLLVRVLEEAKEKKSIEKFISENMEMEVEDMHILVTKEAFAEILRDLEKAKLLKIKKGKVILR
ncbi:hypothetical protein Asulf_00448 [Archaeoglobus sulfaticallidus PM70-1]|uniref:Uncharacterized protein n=1 Tax=Archaeoglobus sulfaticallidus PM70-1 TaxID=387631 RepID=N0BK20_9EURY|nr:hypothetical protein [Archaeoglobus sulfaticallidus]AGK60475.1 hypothetical protein Asulf_00448 [Archaeoglobus sulfaticallidus PM70-1]